MQARRRPGQSAQYLLLVCAIACITSACTFVGPKAIVSGRLAYNEAITETDNQQMLMVLIHNRYGERGHLLTVASITANVSVTTSAAVQTGFGNSSNYEGNLVPFTGGVIYEENPTISYVPVAGERYLRQLTAPISMTLLTQMTRSLTDPQPALLALVAEVNGVYNPDFDFDGEADTESFVRFSEIVAKLRQAHRLQWVKTVGRPGTFSLVIDQSDKDIAQLVKELLTILGLPKERYTSPQIVIPVSLALNSADKGAIGFTTRSVFDMVEILSARIEVPDIDVKNGVVAPAPPPGLVGKMLRVHHSESQPEHAYIAVEYRDGWFYIDERDLRTKEYFKLLGSLWSLTMAQGVQQNTSAPILTVPVN